MPRIEDFQIARVRAGFKSRSALAAAAGIPAQTLCTWDAGRNSPSHDGVAKVAAAIGWKPGDVASAFENARTRKASGEKFDHDYFKGVIDDARRADTKPRASKKRDVTPFTREVREGHPLKVGKSYTFTFTWPRANRGHERDVVRGIVLDEYPRFYVAKAAKGYRFTVPKVALAMREVTAKGGWEHE